MKIGNKVIDKAPSIKFLGVILDEHVSWKYHIKSVENKLSINIGLLCHAKQFLDEISLKVIYFPYFHF